MGLAAAAIFAWTRPGPSGLPEGTVAPSFTVTTADGARFSLDAQRGHAVVIAFWATLCPSCRAEAHDLAAVERSLSTRGDSVVALSVDTLPIERVAAEAIQLGMPSQVALAPSELTAAFAVALLPTTFVIAPSGAVAHVFAGGATSEEILAAVEAAERSDP
jgi:peroxiredoxin